MPLFRIIFHILIGFEHIYCKPLYIIFKCIRRRVREPDRKVLIVFKRFLYILIEGLASRVQCTICLLDMF